MSLQAKRRKVHEKSKDDRLVTINVSGRKFVTWEKTLRNHPTTLLGSDMLGRFFDETRKEYFLDRDPHMFRYVLNFYRVGKLHTSSEDCHDAFKQELDFYGISPNNIESCCWEDNTKVVIRKPRKKCSKADHSTTTREQLWFLLEESNTTRLGAIIQYSIGLIICISILHTIVETIPFAGEQTYGQKYPTIFMSVEGFCIAVFTLEYLLRLYAAENRLRLFFDKLSIIDLLAVLPFYVVIIISNLTTADKIFGNQNPLTLLRILRIVRMFKLSRHSRHMRVVGHMLKRAFVDLGFLFFSFFLANVMFSTIMYYMERDQVTDKFTSIPDTMWYTIVTMMTLGYGDMVPVTVIGKLLGSLCCLMGIMLFALPTTMMQKSASDGKRVVLYNNHITKY